MSTPSVTRDFIMPIRRQKIYRRGHDAAGIDFLFLLQFVENRIGFDFAFQDFARNGVDFQFIA